MSADAAAKPRLAKFTLKRLGATPARVQAGRSFRVRGRVANGKGRRAQTGRLTFSLRNARSSTARREQHLGGKNVKRTKGGRSRTFSVRLRVPASTRAKRYVFFACVRRGSGTLRGSCKSRRMTVTPRPGSPTPGPGPAPGPGGQPSAGDDGARRSLRAPLTGENYYFVMADRFANGDTGNDTGGIDYAPYEQDDPQAIDRHGFDSKH